MQKTDVAIIGGGFCGTMVAVNLARLSQGKLHITLCDRSPAPALGVAYGTTDPQHLLNVPAIRMGAFADRPDDFWHWLQQQPGNYSDQSFAPRMLYGQYLRQILQETQKTYQGLRLLRQDITDIQPQPDGSFVILSGAEKLLRARHIVLALGNFPPGESTNSRRAENPYAPEVWKKLAEPGDVLLIGTGLTSLDLVVTMAHSKPGGAIHLLSRRGLLPRTHTDPASVPSFIDPENMPCTALSLYEMVRNAVRQAAARNIPWQSVIDSMRPYNQLLWEALDPQQKRRFLRFLKPYWDVHRHRCAPEIMAIYERLKQDRRLHLHRGHMLEQKPNAQGIEIIFRPYGKSRDQSFTVKHVVNCTGPQSDCRKLDDKLVQNLLQHNLVSPGPMRIGIATNAQYQTLNASAATVTGCYALGSLLKGRLYESVAVPELRQQAYDVAEQIVKLAHA